jgi:hypothetical protein
MRFELPVFNPSDYKRAGHVTTPWQPIQQWSGIPREELVISDGHGNALPAQIDAVDPADDARASLVFSITSELREGSEHYRTPSDYVFLSSGQSQAAAHAPLDDKLNLEVKRDADGRVVGARFVNRLLTAWFNLIPDPLDKEGDFYAGSFTSVQLNQYEMLDPIRAAMPHTLEFGHDPEKRLQIDRINVLRPPWDDELYQPFYLFNQPYDLISESRGLVRVSLTVASPSFVYEYTEPLTKTHHALECRLHRVISLYAGADHLIEELCVKGVARGVERGAPVYLMFIPRFFAHVHLGLDPRIHQYPHVPDWLALDAGDASDAGYGFATDVHARPVNYPHRGPANPDLQNEHCRFSWETFPAPRSRCLHLFLRDRQEDPRARTASLAGKRWYEVIFKPLDVRVPQG